MSIEPQPSLLSRRGYVPDSNTFHSHNLHSSTTSTPSVKTHPQHRVEIRPCPHHRGAGGGVSISTRNRLSGSRTMPTLSVLAPAGRSSGLPPVEMNVPPALPSVATALSMFATRNWIRVEPGSLIPASFVLRSTPLKSINVNCKPDVGTWSWPTRYCPPLNPSASRTVASPLYCPNGASS